MAHSPLGAVFRALGTERWDLWDTGADLQEAAGRRPRSGLRARCVGGATGQLFPHSEK